jgi:hypothetical protein
MEVYGQEKAQKILRYFLLSLVFGFFVVLGVFVVISRFVITATFGP